MAEEEKFDFKKFIPDSIKILVNPGEYFSGMKKEGGFGDPLIRAVIYGFIAGVITLIYSVMKLGHMRNMFGGMMGGGLGVTALITTVFATVIGLFIVGIIILIISAICSGNTDYEANVRVSASLMVLMPVKSALSFLSGLNFYLGLGIILLTSLYGIYILYFGLTRALDGKKQAAKVLSGLLASIPILIIISSLMCVSAVKHFSKDAEKIMRELPKNSKEFQKNVDKLQKMMQDMEKNKQKENKNQQ